MNSKSTNFYLRLVIYLAVIIGLSSNSVKAQTGLIGGQTYVVNGQADQVFPRDTFVSLSGAGYPSYAAIMPYLADSGVDVTKAPGTITILLASGYTGSEPAAIQVGKTNGSGYPNMGAARPIVLKPAPGLNFTITTAASIAANGSLFRIFGSTDFTIDGSGTTGQRNITFQLLSSTASAKVIDIIPSATNRVRNVNIRNCVIVGNSTATTINTYAGIYFGGSAGTPSSAALGTNLNISYTNNLIMAVQNGIYHRGFPTNTTSFASQDTGININNNIIGDYSNPTNAANTAFIGSGTNSSGIYVQTVSNSTISNNIVRNTLLTSASFAGIRLVSDVASIGIDSNIRVTKNRIYNLYSNVIGQGIYGIRVSLNTHTTSRNILLANNSISRIASTNGSATFASLNYTAGILVDNTTAYAGLEVYFNSVNLVGDTLAANAISACFVTGTGTTGGIRLLNNSFSNTMGRTVGNTSGYQNYVIIRNAAVNPISYSNFNNYHANTLGGGYAFVAAISAGSIYRQISTLKNYRLYNPSDSNSYNTIPPYQSDTVLTVASGVSHRMYNRAYSLNQLGFFAKWLSDSVRSKVTDDILGNPRTGLGRFTSIGCHQWVGDSTNNPSPLIGGRTYSVNGNSAPPVSQTPNTGSFKDLAEAVTYLNAYGISANQNDVILEIKANYPRETNWIPAIVDYPGSGPSNNVIIRTQTGWVDTIWAPNGINPANSSVIRILGGRNITIDGRTGRNLTVMFQPSATTVNARVIGIVPTDTSSQNITIRNLNIVGNSSPSAINTFAGIYMGNPLPATGNFDTLRTVANIGYTIESNNIVGVRNGIYVRGSGGNPSATPPAFAGSLPTFVTNRIQNLSILRNTIGGTIAPGGSLNTTYIGGAADQAGIYIKGAEATVIDSNVIRNCIPTASLSSGFRGIDIDEGTSAGIVYPNFGISITKNFIYNLVTATGTNIYGVRYNFTAATGKRAHLLANNFIGRIDSRGTGGNFSSSNPTGVIIDATQVQSAADLVTLVNNTINMNGTLNLISGSSISALFINTNITGGISSINNIFGVSGNRTTPGNKYAVVVGTSLGSPFAPSATYTTPASDFNAYFVSGNSVAPLTNHFLMANNSASVNRSNINTLRQYTGATADLSSFSWATKFISDTLPDLLSVSAGSRYTLGGSVAVILTDIYGVGRASTGSSLGAVSFSVTNAPLQPGGVYQINGVDNYPTLAASGTGSFRTLRSAVDYLNAFGTGLSFSGVNPAKLVLSSGYVGETDTFFGPITVLDYPFANANVPVIVTVAAGRQDTIKFTQISTSPAPSTTSSLIRVSSGRYFGFDGSNNGTKSRDLTIVMPASMNNPSQKIIDIIGWQDAILSTNLASTNNFVNNCNLIGNSTTSTNNTFAAIYMGGIVSTPSNSAGTGGNNSNGFTNNFIGGCQYGIYLRGNGVRGQHDFGTYVGENVIGGDIAPGGATPTNYFGGINNAAGIFVVGQHRATIEKNQIQNNIRTFTTPRGIELATIAGSNTILDSANVINGNIIKNIQTTLAGGAYGIYMNFGSDNANIWNSTSIQNNMISGISGLGSGTFINNPYGIALDAGIAVDNSNIKIVYNSINLGAANVLTSGQSACVALASQFTSTAATLASKNGLTMVNNIFKNRLGGNAVTTRASGVLIGGNINPFTVSNNNNYYVQATSATNAEFTANASVNPTGYTGWDNLNKFTNDDIYSTSFNVPFTNDTNLFIPSLINSVIYGAAMPFSGITSDVIGTPRNFLNPTMGAHEYTGGNNLDSVSPRIVPSAVAPCLNSLFNTIDFIVADKNYLNDTFYYRVNGGPVSTLQSVSSTTNSGGLLVKTYAIPASAFTGGVIEYKISANDVTPNNGVYPIGKTWDTLQTGISTFPYVMDFENGAQGWTSQSVSGGASWDLAAYGSISNPSQSANSGLKNALFSSSTLAAGATARLISPCFNLSVLQNPTLRIMFSQSNTSVTRKDSIAIKVLVNGFASNLLKFALRPNANSPYADYFPIEVCLTDYKTAGLTYKIQIEAISAGAGQNMLIDDIQIFDGAQNQVITPTTTTVCNLNQPVQVNIPNTDSRFVYRAIQLDNLGAQIGVLDSAFGNNSASPITLNLANRQIDTLRYVVSAINYNTATYQPINVLTQPVICVNNLPGGPFTAIINRFTRKNADGGYIIPDLSLNAFNGSANVGSQFEPDGVKVGRSITYNILSPVSYLANSSYGTAWTILNTTMVNFASSTPAVNFTFTAPNGGNPSKATFTADASEVDQLYALTTTIRFLATNCDTTVTRYVRIVDPLAVNFVTVPRTDSACTGNVLNFTIAGTGTAASGNQYFWDFGDGTTSNFGTGNGIGFTEPVKKTWNSPGIYRVKLRIQTGLGLSDSVERDIRVLQSPTGNYTASSNAIVCQSDSTYFTSAATGAGISYLWSLPGGITRTTANTSFAFEKADTNYKVSLTVTNTATGCFAFNERIFPSYAKPKAKFTVSSHCQGTLLPYVDSTSIPTNENIGLFWTMSNGDSRVSKNFQYVFPNSGSFRVSLRAQTQAGCEDTTSQIVTVYETPRPDFQALTVCVNDSAQFTNQTVYGAGIQNADYAWDFGDNSGINTLQDPKHRYLSNNSDNPFLVKLVASNRLFGCKDSITKEVTANLSPTAVDEVSGVTAIGLKDYKVCEDNIVYFTSKSFSPNQSTITCNWLFGNAGSSGACNTFTSYSASPVRYQYFLIATANGCQSTSTGYITVVAKPTVNYTKVHSTIPASRFTTDNRVKFTANVTPAPAPNSGTKYTWNFGDADSSSFSSTKTDSAVFIYNKKGVYYARVKVTTAEGCEVTYIDTVKVSVGVGINEELAAKFNLSAYPNPFANNAFISFNLETATDVSVSITDILGRTISSIDLGKLSSGKHERELAENLFTSAGTYFIKVKVGDDVIVKTLIKQ